MERVMITRPFVGLIYMQVCAEADATDEEILEVCNRENPSGTTNGWGGVKREDDDPEGPFVPAPCDTNPGRLHFIVYC